MASTLRKFSATSQKRHAIFLTGHSFPRLRLYIKLTRKFVFLTKKISGQVTAEVFIRTHATGSFLKRWFQRTVNKKRNEIEFAKRALSSAEITYLLILLQLPLIEVGNSAKTNIIVLYWYCNTAYCWRDCITPTYEIRCEVLF